MKITLSNGKAFDIRHIGELMRDGNRVVIELEDGRSFSEIAADFESQKTITMTDTEKPNKEDVYMNFTKLVGINENKAAGTVRITLEKGDAV